jgi:chromosome segregation protein
MNPAVKKRLLDAKNNELRLTKNMIDSLEGFPDAIKFLKKKNDWLKKNAAPLRLTVYR